MLSGGVFGANECFRDMMSLARLYAAVTLILCLLAGDVWAKSEDAPKDGVGRGETNRKESPSLQKYNQYLKECGWHRKEADRFSDELSHLFDAELSQPRPLPNFTQYITMLLQKYQSDYAQFEKDFPSVSNATPLSKKVSNKPGMWSHITMVPTAGRIYDLELNPKNPKEMYANPDGDGIFYTKDGGRHWRSITDLIPLREHRDCAENIIVDPKNFYHVFSISHMGLLYEYRKTLMGGKWHSVENKAHKQGRAPQFKWVEAFRNSRDALVIIGVVTKTHGSNGGWKKGVYRTENSGRSWQYIDVKDNNLQEMAFHKRNRNVVYLGGRSKLYISRDAGKTFRLLKDFKQGDRPMFITTLSGKDANGLYVAVSQGKNTQVHFSPDEGKTWELRQDSAQKIGFDQGIFGGDGSSGWTTFFEVDPFDKNHLMASSVGSCESFDGGVNWKPFSWGKRADAVMADGSIAPSPHGGHNADNHVLKFHPRLKDFRVKGCDAGIMMKREKRATNWININGDMPAFLWYSIIVNEFGDHYLAGNTQDVNVQTNRYGRWENEAGYEGNSIFINPYTNVTYYPCCRTDKEEGQGFLEPGWWKMHSWTMVKSFVNYSNPDQLFVVMGRREDAKSKQLPKWLYMTNDRGVHYQRVPNVEKEVFIVNMSRTKPQVLTLLTAHDLMQSLDMGKTWKTQAYPKYFKSGGRMRKVSGSINPENPKQIWIGGMNGKVLETLDGGKKWKDISANLPKGQVVELVYHEGTQGDLYALVNGFGVFYRASGAKEWKFWMDGYNLKDFREIRIDYPNQRMVAASYGRGAWTAPLMKPCERFYKNGFKIKQLNDVAGVKVFGVDSDWVTPDYYRYKWFVNGKEAGRGLPELRSQNIKSGDSVQLVLQPRFTPNIQTKSSVLKAVDAPKTLKQNADASLMMTEGHLDLGVLELFGAGEKRTWEMMVKLDAPGVLAGSRRQFYKDAKGWLLSVDQGGKLTMLLSPKQNANLHRTFKVDKEQAIRVESANGAVPFKQWVMISFSISAKGGVTLFVDGKRVAQGTLGSLYQKHSLNSVMNTCVFSDSMGLHGAKGRLKSLTIWDLSMSGEKYLPIGVDSQTIPHVLYALTLEKGKGAFDVLTGKKMHFRKEK